ncbi:hypothetical protein OBE_14280, partial [human gut metagenome]
MLVAAIAESGRIIYAVPPIGNDRILPPARVGILYAAKLNIAAVIEPDDMNLIEVRNSEYLKFQNSDVSTVFDISRFIYDKRYDKINDIYKEQLIPSELGLVIGAITESQKLIDDAIKLEKEGGKILCAAAHSAGRQFH